MRLNCFKAAGANGLHTLDENGNEVPRPRPQAPPKSKSARILRRHASQDSRSSNRGHDDASATRATSLQMLTLEPTEDFWD
ncbi:hypothetical protein KC359_g76 [Hortaea werneckii]|nr:hypothetical protein KC359_g76 [Hortaea werneckii]KAI7514825.1 hypothetical protein KC347_g72 [Hortaea werneckii]